MLERDFTLKKYKKLCDAIVASGYTTITLSDYLINKDSFKSDKFLIMRHDIDNKVDLPIAQKMAEYEHLVGIKASYYFRTVQDVFNVDIIKEVFSKGHEVGYHYEVLNESKGDVEKAFKILKENLERFRNIIPIQTICQHGGSLGEYTASTFTGILKAALSFARGKIEIKSYKSNDIWKYRNFHEFNLLGESYLSLDFNKIIYISDTGVRWDSFKNRVLDVIDTDYYQEQKTLARTTEQLIYLLKSNKYQQLNLLVHPANWIDPFFDWLAWQTLQKFRDFGKKILLINKN